MVLRKVQLGSNPSAFADPLRSVLQPKLPQILAMNSLGNLAILLLSLVLSTEFCISFNHERTDHSNAWRSSSFLALEFGQTEGLIGQIPNTPIQELESSYWRNAALNTLEENLRKKPNKNRAKNIILFLGDGMSMPTVAAARIFKGQLHKEPGEETRLAFEDFPSVGLSKTYCTDTQVADSACSSTAYHCGVKGAYYTVGLNGNVRQNDCAGSLNESHHVTSIVTWAQDARKWTGSVTTTRITHASPAGGYAHSGNREWESDANLPKDCKAKDIAHQLIHNSPGKDIHVLLGGGRKHFLPTTKEYNGTRLGGENLINSWKEGKRGKKASYVQNKMELKAVQASETDYLFGLFAMNHMDYYVDADHSVDPSLEEMTEKAIEILQKGPNGFFLFVEGGKIDLAHHDNYAHKALVETVEFEKAIVKALSMTSVEDTLIVVTADHSHSFTFNGYPKRGNSIFGFSDELSDIDMKPYTTLSYSNGPVETKYEENHARYNLSRDDTSHEQYQFPAMVPLTWETHGGDDIGVYAIGPWAHLLDGQFDQNYIPIVMGHAANILPSHESASSAVERPLVCLVFTILLTILSVIIT